MTSPDVSAAPTTDASARPPAVRVEPLLEVRDLRVTFRTAAGPVAAVRGVDLTVRRRSTLVLVGESGSGKSVTARSVLGLTDGAEVSGSVRFLGEELVGIGERRWRQYRGAGMSIVFQDPMRSLNPTMRVGHQVAEAVRQHSGLGRKEAARRAVELFELVRIPSAKDRAGDYPHQLSGGMRQRVMMAIAVSANPKVLIADEPTTALDVTTQAQIMELLRDLQRELEMGILLITHDMGLAFSYGDEIAVMYAGRIVERAPAPALMSEVRMPYTRGLLDSVPRLSDTPHTQFHALRGRPPSPTLPITGCPFAPRCAYRQERCTAEAPALGGEAEHEWACWYPL